MSLLDAFLEDGLAASVLEKSDVWFAVRKDRAVGSGSREDPFDGSTAAHFDAAMADVPANTTIHLGPSTADRPFLTAGGTAWQPKSGQRIVGAGINATRLKLVNSSANVDLVVVGTPGNASDATPTATVDGFELSDLTIDGGVTGSWYDNAAASGVSVTGANIYVRRIKVVDFGGKRSDVCVGISAAWAAAALSAQNCMIEECEVGAPFSGSGASGKLIAFRLAGVADYYHKNCVIRNCWFDGGDTALDSRDIRGMVATGGEGTMVEGNRIKGCQWGGPFQDTADAMLTKDLMVRGNVYAGVREGPSLSLADTKTVGRVVIINNTIELGTSDGVCGIKLYRSAANGFANGLIRGNQIRYNTTPGTLPNSDYGIRLTGCTNAIVDNNLIDVGPANNAVYHTNCTIVAPFNNQTSGAVFRPGFDGTLHDQELTTEVEDVLLGLLMR